MGGDLNKITQLRMINEYIPNQWEPIKHPTGLEFMDKLNEVIKIVKWLT
jgi:hypothetical protein